MISFLNKNTQKNKKTLLMIFITFFTVISLLFIIVFNSLSYLKNNAKEILIQKADYYCQDITNEFEEIFDLLYSTANMISLHEDITSPQIMEALRNITKSIGFDRMAITTPDGISYTDDNVVHNSSDRTYFIEGMKGNITVTEIEKSILNDLPFIAFSCPIYKDDTVVGVLRITVTKDHFTKMLAGNNEINTKDVFLIDSKGSVILINEYNYFDEIIKGNKKNDSIANDFEKAITNRQEKFIEYSNDKTIMYAYSKPFKYNSWSLITTDTRSNLFKSINNYYIYNIIIAIVYILFLVVVLLFYKYTYRRDRDEIKLLKKENHIIDDIPSVNIFRYDIENKRLLLSKSMQDLIGSKEYIENVPESLYKDDNILPEYKNILIGYFEKMKPESRYNEEQFKVIKSDGQHELYKIYSKTIFNNNTPVKTIGFLEAIYKKKGIEDYEVQNDSLTGLYNKLATKNLINEYINNNSNDKCAFMIIDIFNLNKINEKYGYNYGDDVIINIAAQLKMLFRSSDILGRSSDDEFILFLKNVKTHEFLEDKIQLILNSIKNIMSDEKSLSVMINIGVSMYPQNASDFNELYENAETALFKAKKKGAGQYELFTEVEL